ncbi:MAG TPA: hypothetical protein VEP28_01710, partial [Rubrobacter sp.]|nr:hypothetical protein [Rubrobacter sp.]
MKSTTRAVPALLSAFSVLVVLAVLAVLVVLDVLPAQGQLPRPQKPPYSTIQLKHYVTSAAFPWTLTVCKGTPYAGDYADLSDALAAIPTRFPLRGPSQRVLVLLYPCSASPSLTGPNYEETNLLVPSFTTLQGVPAGASGGIDTQSARVTLRLTGTSTTCEGCPSALLKLENGTNLINLYVQSSTPPTGPIRVVEVAGAVTLT